MVKTNPIITDNATAAAAETPEIPSTVTINGVDYDPIEAESFITKGKQTSELEKQWNTSVDKVWPEYGKSQETLKQRDAELAEAKAQLTEFQTKQNAGVETPTDLREAQEAARKLGIVLNEDIEKQGYIKKDELPGLFQSWSQEQEAVRQIIATADGLEKEIDGSDGRPAFNKKVVLAYANAYGVPDLKAAYEDMNKTQLDSWKAKQVTDKRNPGLKTLEGGGSKDVKKVDVTGDNVKDLMKEALWGGNSE